MLGNNDHIHVYSPGAGADNPAAVDALFHKHNIFYQFSHLLNIVLL